jgi:KipI family sensor histidine kinase inhibitor
MGKGNSKRNRSGDRNERQAEADEPAFAGSIMVRLEPFGEYAFVIKVAEQAGEQALHRVRSLVRHLESQAWPDGVEIVPALVSVAIVFEDDALRKDFQGNAAVWLADRLRQMLAKWEPNSEVGGELCERFIELPVCYGGEYGPDLPDVAALCRISEGEAVRLHSERTYRVGMLGFLPGFPYLLGLDERLHVPRRDVPRVTVPSGAVGIGGAQTGVYPVDSPGGWQLIGRTPARLLDVGRQPPSLLEAGDLVRFVPITEERYKALAGEEEERERIGSGREIEGGVTVVSAGLLATVQDGGRVGYRRYGVPRSGALDPWALRMANALVGNEPGAAGLECTLLGPELRFGADVLFAVCGGEFELRLDGEPVPSGRPVRAPAGSALTVGRAAIGCRGSQ